MSDVKKFAQIVFIIIQADEIFPLRKKARKQIIILLLQLALFEDRPPHNNTEVNVTAAGYNIEVASTRHKWAQSYKPRCIVTRELQFTSKHVQE